MRNPLMGAIVGLAAVLVLSSAAAAQTAQPQANQGNETRSPWKFYPTDRSVGDGGPAPKRDLTGSWAGPSSGMAVPRGEPAEKPTLTPLGQQLMSQNKPLGKYSPAGTNDPHVRYCDPFGFPENMTTEIRGLAFTTMPDRIIMLIQYQDLWREVWMDGRALPANVGGREKDALDPTYNGYSVGHWEDDYTFIVDTTGLDENTWLNGAGYPHTVQAHVQERYTRVDHNDLQLTVTVDDPTLYTKPFVLGKLGFKWWPSQQLAEQLCIPSEMIQYLSLVGDPGGNGVAPEK